MSNKYFQILKEYSIVALACIVMAFNINYFFLANKLAEGGIAGISLIIHYLTHMDIGYLYFILNIPLIILAYIFIGKDFLIKTLFATLVLTIFLKFFGDLEDLLMIFLWQQFLVVE